MCKDGEKSNKKMLSAVPLFKSLFNFRLNLRAEVDEETANKLITSFVVSRGWMKG